MKKVILYLALTFFSNLTADSVCACSNYKGILFDLDDTLIDFKIAEQRSLSIVYENIYNSYISFDDFVSAFHLVNKGLWKDFEEGKVLLGTLGRKRFDILSKELSAKIDTELVADLYERSLGTTSEWLPEALDNLNILKENFSLGIVTNGFSKVQQIKYQKFSIASWCQCYVVSEEVSFFKPSKEIFDIALHKMGYQPHEVLMVGDSISSDYKGALNAGMDFCWVNPFEQELPKELPKPKYIVNSISKLVSIFNI